MPDIVRFPCDLPYDKSLYAIAVFSSIVNGDWAGAKAIYDANPQEVSDTMGQMDKCRKAFNPAPPPSGTDIQARLKVSQNCAWGNLITPTDHNWAMANFDPALVRLHVQYYNGEGGGVRLNSYLSPIDGWMFQTEDGRALPDVNHAADTYIATIRNNVPPALG